MPEMHCSTCGETIGGRGKTGLCRQHALIAAARNPATIAKRVASWQRTFATDPTIRQKQRAAAIASSKRPGESARRSAAAKAQGLAAIGRAARTPEALARGGRTSTERRLGWCPPELRAEYRKMLSRHWKAAEAKAILLEHHAREIERYRRKLGVVPVVPDTIDQAPDVDESLPVQERVPLIAASVFGVAVEALTSKGRQPHLVRARWTAMLALKDAGLSGPAIAKVLGLNDHSSVVYGIAQAEALIANDGEFAARAEMVRAA